MKDFLATQNMENIIKLYGQEKSEKVCKFYVSAGSRDGLPISTCPHPLSLTSPPVLPISTQSDTGVGEETSFLLMRFILVVNDFILNIIINPNGCNQEGCGGRDMKTFF